MPERSPLTNYICGLPIRLGNPLEENNYQQQPNFISLYRPALKSPSYFGQRFKDVYGPTPSEYIEKDKPS